MINVKQYGIGAVIYGADKLSPVLKKVGKNLDITERRATGMVSSIKTGFSSVQSSFSGFQSTMMRSGAMMAGAGAIMAPFIITGKEAATFKDVMGDIKSLLVTKLPENEVENELQAIESELIRVGNSTRVPLMDMATGFYKLESAIDDTEEARAALDWTQMMGVAGKGSFDDAVDAMTLFLNTYGQTWDGILESGEKASKIANTVVGAVAAFNTTLPQLGQALQYVGGPAKSIGMTIEDLVTVIGKAQTSGLPGTLAGTALNAFIRQAVKLVSKTGEEVQAVTMDEYLRAVEAGATAVPKASIKNLGFTDEDGKLLSFIDILKKIELQFGITSEVAEDVRKSGLEGADAFKQMGIPASFAAQLLEGFGEEGSRAILTLLGQADALRETSDEIERSNNLQKMYQARMETLMARIQAQKNAFQGLAITIGEQLIPAQEEGGDEDDLLEKLRKKTVAMQAYAEDNPVQIRVGAGVAGSIAALLGIGAGINIAAWAAKPIMPFLRLIAPFAIRVAGPIAAIAGLFELYDAFRSKYRDGDFAKVWDLDSVIDQIGMVDRMVSSLIQGMDFWTWVAFSDEEKTPLSIANKLYEGAKGLASAPFDFIGKLGTDLGLWNLREGFANPYLFWWESALGHPFPAMQATAIPDYSQYMGLFSPMFASYDLITKRQAEQISQEIVNVFHIHPSVGMNEEELAHKTAKKVESIQRMRMYSGRNGRMQ